VSPEGPLTATTVEDARDIVAQLPLGFGSSILAAQQCTFAELTRHSQSGEEQCPASSIVGHLETWPAEETGIDSPIFNMVPERGAAAEFAYIDLTGGTHVFYGGVVPTPKGYVVQVINPELPQVNLHSVEVIFYGNPVERDETGGQAIPLFTDPDNCTGEAPAAKIFMDSWQHPAKFSADGTPVNLDEPQWARAESKWPLMTGCDSLRFNPEFEAQPTTHEADSPSGLNAQIKVPQPEAPEVVATPTMKTATVTFPEGMTVDPSAGGGLEACSNAQIGWEGPTVFDFSPAPPTCPEGSKIGELELETPLLPGVLHGQMYLAAQNENPFGSVFATYVVVHDPVTGIILKIAGEVKPDSNTGRLVAVFAENPDLPFSDLKLHFFGGPRAEFATPQSCGDFGIAAELEPWSAPSSGPNASLLDYFLIDENCVVGFAPSFTAGATNVQAGSYTTFDASFSRSDSDQEFAGLTFSLPPGLLASVGNVPQCSEAQINEAKTGTGGCPESARVGSVTAFAGPGPDPLFVAGAAYLTGPYNGGPYGLAVVVPAVAGPFHLGNVVVRQSLRIDPHTAQVTDVSDPFPTILDPTGANGQTAGIPIKLRRVDVSIDRPDFVFNPTSCEPMAITGTITSNQGATANASSGFQVTDCQRLKFTPKFSVSTSGKTSKALGASLTARVTYPPGSLGAQAGLQSARVELPKALPSRLTTLQKACTAKQFETNPAGCPAESVIGHSVVHTEILPVPLEGAAYFVSHGGEAFPSLEIVLQGDGVTIDLVGSTFISKAGITSTTFKATPDTPFESFELTLPEGKFSALAANGNLCAEQSALKMPTDFVGQNGATLNQDTPIAVEGCAPSIYVVKDSVKGKTATIQVSVPAAGRLVATGKGLSKGAGKSTKSGTVTVKLHLTGAEVTFLGKHKGRKLKATINLTFTPKSGAKLKTSARVVVG
jgi:hypothetical protein